MKLTIAKEHLLQGLQSVQNAATSRTTLAILSNVLLETNGTWLQITATDLDLTISTTVECKVEVQGSTTLPAKRLLEIVREFPSPEIQLEMERTYCSIQGGASYYKVHAMPATDFPTVTWLSGNSKVVLPQAKIRTMLQRTAFAASTDETRYVLNGSFLSFRDHKLTMVATDGRRLSLAEEEAEIPEQISGEVIIPNKAVNELGRLLKESGDLEIQYSENQVSFVLLSERGAKTLLMSKRVEGNYPNYRQVIPTQCAERIALDRELFYGALRRAEIMTSDKMNSVKLTFSDHTLVISSNTPDVGEAREVLAINYAGKEVSIAFNPSFMMEPLRVLDMPEVFFEITDELSPGVLKINGPFLYVIMPMRMS